MSMITAFVGHSFNESDKKLIDTFLDYLNEIKAMNIGFTWEHAKAAEPKELSEKVKHLIKDKDLFVGICTKKECVIQPIDLEPCWLKKKVLGGHVDKFLWKTSDWVIQEIGLAIGLKMHLLLLLEEGVRTPGGLQGNVEYITFDRQNPERSFIKISEMIRALKPKADQALTQELGTSSSESAGQVQSKEEIESEWYEPKPEWNFNYYRLALFNSIKTDNHEAEKKITFAFLESVECKGPRGSVGWEAYSQYLRLSLGKGGTLGKMEDLAKDMPEVDMVHYYLGQAYEVYKDYRKAAQAYLNAAEVALDSEGRLLYLGDAAIAYCHAKMMPESEDIGMKMRQEVLKSGVGEEILIEVLKELANIQSDMDVYFGVTERLLELHPDDNTTRFELALKYSQSKDEKLSLFHYLRIPESGRLSGTWNNLGVQYDTLKIGAASIRSYRKAEQDGETLAMSNIANKLIQAGFLPEAQDICNKAITFKDYHNNVNQAIARIRDIPEEEMKLEEGIVKDATPYSDFYKAYGKALYEAYPINYIGEWEGPKCRLSLKIQDRSFLAEGFYEAPKTESKAVGLSAYLGRVPSAPPGKYVVKYVGTLLGHSIKAVMTEVADNSETGSATNALMTLLGGRTKRTVLMVISDSFSEIRVYDKDAPQEQRLYVLRKLSDGE